MALGWPAGSNLDLDAQLAAGVGQPTDGVQDAVAQGPPRAFSIQHLR